MKHTFKYIFAAVAMLVPVLAHAQGQQLDPPQIYSEYNVQGGVATAKSLSEPDENGVYTITLETFATGLTSIITKAIPSDIVLLLDYSSSMLTNDNITKLKQAVVTFVEQMQDNNSTLNLQPGQMGNRIAFVLYAGLLYDDYPETTQHVNNNNSLPLLNDYPYFNAKYVNQFIEVEDMTASGSQVMYQNVNIISPSSQHAAHPSYLGGNNFGDTNKGTNTPAAMAKALDLVNANLAQYSSSSRSTTVVLFTDGEPCNIYQSYYGGTGSSGFTASYANDCLASAKTIKGKGVNIFSVGLFNYNGNNSQANRQTRTFVEYTSSNYPDIAPTANNYWTNNANLLNIDDPMSGDYCSIVSSGLDLSGVFKKVAEASGGSEQTIPGQTQVVDCVSNSFEVPSDFNVANITVYTRTINKAGTEFGNRKDLTPVVITDQDALFDGSYLEDLEDGQIGVSMVDGKLTVVGFNYSKADDEGVTPYNGNWVGWRNENDCAGKELVIEFPVEGDPAATGGDGTNTNTAESGIYVPIFDENGNITGYNRVNQYEVPHADLPVNLVIEKTGLRHGESATIQIYMSEQKVENGKIVYDPNTGKPAPLADPAKPGKEGGWKNFSKVILTNMGNDGDTVTKTLLALDAKYVYLLVEDNWGWAYNLDDRIVSTSEVEKNPLLFVNTEKTDAVKHAEAVSVNHFGVNARAETAKSSKTKTFTSGSDTESSDTD
jgi:hypothetical protein